MGYAGIVAAAGFLSPIDGSLPGHQVRVEER